ncbi:unnamed protein product [Sphacelaria rigidula]
MDTSVFMTLPDGRGPLTGSTGRLEKSLHGVKQAGRQWSLLLNITWMEDARVLQSEADPCACK